MNRFLIASLAAMAAIPAAATHTTLFDQPAETAQADSTGFKFTDIIDIRTTPVKDQNKSGTCWSFAGTSMLEDDIIRKGGPEVDLSEMFTVRQAYIDKARKYIRMGGKINFAQGGQIGDVVHYAATQGLMPEEAYRGLEYGEDSHSHYEMFDVMKGYLDGVLRNSNKHLSDAWLPGFCGILDAYLGKVPETFTWNGKTYTPVQFAKEMKIVPEEYVTLTSYTHHPFYTSFAIEIPDNWMWAESFNVPLEEMKAAVDNALEKGCTVGWAADVSEGGFKWAKGYALLPEKKTEADMTNSELSKWVKLSDKDREKQQFEITGPVKEQTVTQESRQKHFDNFDTTDDHGMVITGVATDQEGNRYYKVKNSWNTNQIYDGYFYVSEPYFLDKTIAVMFNRAGLPATTAAKMKR